VTAVETTPKNVAVLTSCVKLRQSKPVKNWRRREALWDARRVKLAALLSLALAGTASAAPLVVLDPGHGGSNLGALGAAGIHEKELTLQLALQVATRLREHGIEVRLTRTDDRTLTLRQRVEVADQLPADLFVSIHANASPARSQRGYETWILSAKGIDIESRALRGDTATRRPGVDSDVGHVLDDVERGISQWRAAELAARIQAALRDVRGPDGDRGVRQGAPDVLLGASMPAVLVEVGFIDHPVEGRELVEPHVQAQIADAVASAIEAELAD
jgi:N-acetylmuramoyl-L-alanine amidase